MYEHASAHYGNKQNCPSQAWHQSACAAGSVEGTTCTSKFPKKTVPKPHHTTDLPFTQHLGYTHLLLNKHSSTGTTWIHF